MKKLVLSGVACAVLAGCAAPQYTGQGEYFELENVNLVERDLSLIEPLPLLDTMLPVVPEPKKRIIKKPNPLSSYMLREGESYESAMRRWLKREGYQSIAWSVQPEHHVQLSDKAEAKQIFYGSFKKVWAELGKQLDIPLQVVSTEYQNQKVAGVYDFEGKARITRVGGDSLRPVIQNVVEHYGFKWDDSLTHRRSWLAKHDYAFSASYYVVTPWDDIDTALRTVLDGYPVTASILDSTGQVFIEEEN